MLSGTGRTSGLEDAASVGVRWMVAPSALSTFTFSSLIFSGSVMMTYRVSGALVRTIACQRHML